MTFAIVALLAVTLVCSPIFRLMWRERKRPPHIVQFANGAYGVRRYDAGWEVLGEGADAPYFWSVRSSARWHRFGTKLEARNALKDW